MEADLARYEDGQTPIGDISGLRLPLTTRTELNAAEFKNYLKAHTKYFLAKLSKFDFTYERLFKVHADMFGDVWEWAGKQRTSDTGIGIDCGRIGSEIHKLLHEFTQWEENSVPKEEIAVRLHHRLVFIHPFVNGNGRWARMIANIYLFKNGQPIIEWPPDPAFVDKIFRPAYISALKQADKGNLEPLQLLHREYSKSL